MAFSSSCYFVVCRVKWKKNTPFSVKMCSVELSILILFKEYKLCSSFVVAHCWALSEFLWTTLQSLADPSKLLCRVVCLSHHQWFCLAQPYTTSQQCSTRSWPRLSPAWHSSRLPILSRFPSCTSISLGRRQDWEALSWLIPTSCR